MKGQRVVQIVIRSDNEKRGETEAKKEEKGRKSHG